MAYTYLIGWSEHDKWYYGSRYAKNCHPDELWKKYKTSSKYVKEMTKKHGDPDVIEVRKVFEDKKKCMLWENKVLKRLNVINDNRWINKTDNMAIDFHSMKKTVEPGLAAAAKVNCLPYSERYDEETAKRLKKQASKVSKANWADPEIRARMSKKPTDTSKYREAALRRWAKARGGQ